MNNVARWERQRRADLFGEAAVRRDLADALIEKDFWVCWTLKQIFSIPEFQGRVLFKGGTSLSKVFGAIYRFSEDIDLAVEYTSLGFTGVRDPWQAGLSRSKQTRILAEMLATCRGYIQTEFVPVLAARFRQILGDTGSWDLQISTTDAHVVTFRYPAAVGSKFAYVAPQVVLELGTHAEFIPRGEFTIRPFAAEEFPGVFEEPDAMVTALLGKRTFWEKATILHAEYHRAPEVATPSRYSRHYYDLATLTRGEIKQQALADLDLLAQVVRHKKMFYPSAWARYDLAVPGTLRLMPNEVRIPGLRADYRAMAPMIFGKAPGFDDILAALSELEREINR